MNDKKSKKVNVLGVMIDDLSLDKAAETVKSWIESGGKHYIVTPNPEFVMAALGDKEFKDILNNADLAIPDGVGLKIGSDIENTTSGIDLLEKLCEYASKKGLTTGFLGGRDGVAVKTAECLQKKYPGLKVVFAEDGGKVDNEGSCRALPPPDVLGRFTPCGHSAGGPRARHPSLGVTPRDFPPVDILFVAFGQVKQEKWIAKNLPKLPVKVAMGVGGSFDEISGKLPRIPGWVQRLGLKWLVRLILQPWRIKRQLALIKFVWLVLTK